MSISNPFPPYQPSQATLAKPELINYLLRVRGEGHPVYTEGDGFVIELEEGTIDVHPTDDVWRVGFSKMGILQTLGDAKTEQELEKLVARAAGSLGHDWPFRPTTGRLAASTPATNYRTISDLIGGAKVEAVFDPYLENRSLATLIDILSFGGGGVANVVRLLGSTQMTQGRIPRFSKAGVTAWLTQLGISGDARVVPPKDEHRRFLLITGGQSLILGPSLNSIHKNEAVRVEPDTHDRPFFDSVWATASPL